MIYSLIFADFIFLFLLFNANAPIPIIFLLATFNWMIWFNYYKIHCQILKISEDGEFSLSMPGRSAKFLSNTFLWSSLKRRVHYPAFIVIIYILEKMDIGTGIFGSDEILPYAIISVLYIFVIAIDIASLVSSWQFLRSMGWNEEEK